VWLEAKAPHTFKTRSGLEQLLGELKLKLETCLSKNEPVPDELLLTDFDTHLAWPIAAFRKLIEAGDGGRDILKRLGPPIVRWTTGDLPAGRAALKDAIRRWQQLSKERIETSHALDLDSLVSSLLRVSSEFRREHLRAAVTQVGRNRLVRKLFNEWIEAGGELAVSMVTPLASKKNVGAEEAFVELCFHSVMVRAFAVKWMLDHGYLNETRCAKFWGLISEQCPAATIRQALCPDEGAAAERLLGDVFRSTNVYMWILDCAPAALWAGIKNAFNRYSLVAERTDILGEFYQRYMRLYAKEAQLLLGQFYTPHTLTRAMWRLAGEVLRKRGVSLADESCLVIDPAVGTGTFLTQGLRLLLDGSWGSTKRQYSGRELSKIAARFTGFEINPLSRGVAVVNCLTELLAHSSDGCKSFKTRIRVFETNAYDVPDKRQEDWVEDGELTGADGKDFTAWRQEVLAASQAKKRSQYRIVVANPPWRNPSPACKNKRLKSILKDDVMPWAWEYAGESLSSIKGCIHGVREDYAFFMGLAVRLLQARGLMVFVTNESWLAAPTYTLLRKYLLDHFRVHAVVRIGPYFHGVKERAAILIAESGPVDGIGRDQEIRYLDWSDLTRNDWSATWIDERLHELISGEVGRNEWTRVVAMGKDCRIRSAGTSSYANDL
jgi:hypothetical protein